MTKLLYTARAETAGGRDNGFSRSSDGLLDIKLSTPGSSRIGTNPEQLLAAAWSASFANAIALAARKRKIMLPGKVSIAAEVDLNLGETGHFLGARLYVTIPGLEHKVAGELTDEAGKFCPYSKATCGNVVVRVVLI